MKHRNRGPGRLVVAATLFSLVLSATSGCSLLDFGGNDSFDEWYSGPRDAFDPGSIGCTSLDGDFSGFVLNDVLLRTPVMLVYETTRTALVPFAASCFACRRLFGAEGAEVESSDVSDAGPSGRDETSGVESAVEGGFETAS